MLFRNLSGLKRLESSGKQNYAKNALLPGVGTGNGRTEPLKTSNVKQETLKNKWDEEMLQD